MENHPTNSEKTKADRPATNGVENEEMKADLSVQDEELEQDAGNGDAAKGDAEHDHEGDSHAAGDDHTEHKSTEDMSMGEELQYRMDHYLDPDHLIEHVQDSTYFEVPNFIAEGKKLEIWQPLDTFTDGEPVIEIKNEYVSSLDLKVTKLMVIELIAAVLIAASFIWLARKIKNGDRPKGRFLNLLETMVVFVRDDIARPSIGAKEADRFLPYLWTVFFFVLVLNLLGLVPFMGSPTGALGCTIVLALSTFYMVLSTGFKKLGVIGFWKAQAPHMDLPPLMAFFLVPMIWAIEVFGLFIKHLVLALRLFANMFAGHLVLAAFIGFIGVLWLPWLFIVGTPAVLGGSTGMVLLELLVAFIQAYVFTFLSALFIGAAVHPH